MGNSSAKPAAMPVKGTAHFSRLEEDIMCSVCLHELSDPVSISCGHTFCRECITSYWATTQPLGYRCPECRKVCPKDQLIPVYRLQQMVTKVQLVVKEEQARQVSVSAVQLVYTDSLGQLQLDESVVQRCFLDSEIADYPVCLICVIGEKRRGKSTLMNYILRALDSQEKGQELSLGGNDEHLKGFEWRNGADSLTKGIWMWNRPFILEKNGDKMAVFVLDTEGSLDIESNRETCMKLSALSMLLSSYLIFNINASLKTTELDYLEMYIHISDPKGDSLSLKYLQHLDILVRDWNDPGDCGREAAQSYIKRETEKMQKSSKHSRVLLTLRSPSVSGFLLPHPGISFLKSSQGTLADMDDDFRSHLTSYIFDLVGKIWYNHKTNVLGVKITCADLGRTLKGRQSLAMIERYYNGLSLEKKHCMVIMEATVFMPVGYTDYRDVGIIHFGEECVSFLQRAHYGFDSPIEMFYLLENRENKNKIIKTFQEFMNKEAPVTSSPFKILGVKPCEMRSKVSEKASRLLEDYQKLLKGDDGDGEKQKLMEEMESLLTKEQDNFCDEYSKRFKICAIAMGFAVGGGVLSLAGGAAGVVVAGAVLAAEAALVIGSSIGGSIALGAIGSGVGAGVGALIGDAEKKKESEHRDDNKESSEDTQQLLDD